MIKLVLIQRNCMHYRIPVFNKLLKQIDLTLYYGTNTAIQLERKMQFKKRCLRTWQINFTWGIKNYNIVFFPSLIYWLMKDQPEIIVTEGTTNIFNNIFIVLYGKLTNTPVIWWDAGRRRGASRTFIRTLVDPLINYILRKATAYIVYGSVAQQYLISLGISPAKIFIAQNAIEFKHIKKDEKSVEIIKQKYGLNDKSIILYVGIIEKRKKIENLLDVLIDIRRKYDDVALLIVGDGSHRKNIERYILKNNIKDVYLTGEIVDTVSTFFNLCRVFVLPSVGGLAINQAMAYGKPVIVSSADGTEVDLVKNGINGFIVEEDNNEQLKDAILRIIFNDELQIKMGKESFRLIKKVSIDNMVQGIMKAIHYVYD